MQDSQSRSRHWNDNHAKQNGQIDSDLSGLMAMLLIVALGAVTIILALSE